MFVYMKKTELGNRYLKHPEHPHVWIIDPEKAYKFSSSWTGDLEDVEAVEVEQDKNG